LGPDTWGVDDYAVNIKLVLEGNRPAPIRILGMRPVKHCQEPLTGTFLLSPSAGADSSVRIGINLDEPRPITRKLQGGIGLKGDYFAEKTVSLKRGEQQTFQITAVAWATSQRRSANDAPPCELPCESGSGSAYQSSVVKARRTNTPPAADSTRIATDSTRPSGRFTMPFPCRSANGSTG
jgi:hypothetical protein